MGKEAWSVKIENETGIVGRRTGVLSAYLEGEDERM